MPELPVHFILKPNNNDTFHYFCLPNVSKLKWIRIFNSIDYFVKPSLSITEEHQGNHCESPCRC